ncbi:hypothetical protein [Nocardia terpenica]|uniref:Uncharacterized protein n=1 Tax=Nocardia terpenica TaxID=455432 RepID=A0A291RPX0_9NOCA|nr:hypothetical protein [Nocardia terpenica]ATL69661.1 hypothetical protein CRH09_29310 [Nocardia terpenica]
MSAATASDGYERLRSKDLMNDVTKMRRKRRSFTKISAYCAGANQGRRAARRARWAQHSATVPIQVGPAPSDGSGSEVPLSA